MPDRRIVPAVRPVDPVDAVGQIVEAALGGAIVGRRPCPYTSSTRLEELEVLAPGGARIHLLAKHLGRSDLSENARRAKPAHLHSATRELAVYRDLLAGLDLATPSFIGGRARADSGVLVLERVEGAPLSQIGDSAAWEAAARWSARMHATFAHLEPSLPAGLDESPDARACLLRYDVKSLAPAGRQGLERADALQLGSGSLRAALRAGHEQALEMLGSAVPTLVHGDFYPSNIVVTGARTAVVDWELAGWGPGILDLAALVAGRWSGPQRRRLARAYHAAAVPQATVEPFAGFLRRLELASLHLALSWLGAAPDWEAPDDHRQDWFSQALAALGRAEVLAC